MGIVRIGNPDRHSPVLLTGNFHLTVERVKKALHGINAFLLIANSRGINVWCAATGGFLTYHDVISVLKTSGIEDLVDHREVILPQLVATGVERKTIKEKTGWKGIWGPVYAKDIPAFLKNKLTKTETMKQVNFPLKDRLEVSISWAFPIAVLFTIFLFFFWPEVVVPVVFLIFGYSILIFGAFPIYRRWLTPPEAIAVLGQWWIPLVIFFVSFMGLMVISMVRGDVDLDFMFSWGIVLFLVIFLLSIDLMGSTPLYKGGFHKDRRLIVILDETKCKGVGFCEQVCPRNCYEVDRDRLIATRPRAHLCVQCGACIVQCPFDALFFESTDGETIPPDTVRKFKLNLMGKRSMNIKGA